jgi:hypothetical protein
MLVDKLTPSQDWEPAAMVRWVRCTGGDYVHFTPEYDSGQKANLLAILAGSDLAARWLSARAEVQGIGQADKVVGKRAKRIAPDWLESGGRVA